MEEDRHLPRTATRYKKKKPQRVLSLVLFHFVLNNLVFSFSVVVVVVVVI
jgi:hypothetical protein